MRAIVLILVALFATATLAQLPGIPGLLDPATVASPNGQETVSYIVSEDCEGTGTPSGWVDVASPNWDDTTSPAPLIGSQSLRMASSSTSTIYTNFTPLDECWAFATIQALGISSSPYAVQLRDTSGSTISAVRLLSGTGVRVSHGTVNASSSGGVISTGITYRIWLHYVKGSGANGVAQAYVSTTETRPGSPTISTSVGDSVNQVGGFRISTGANGTNYWDKLRFSAQEIGSNPQ